MVSLDGLEKSIFERYMVETDVFPLKVKQFIEKKTPCYANIANLTCTIYLLNYARVKSELTRA